MNKVEKAELKRSHKIINWTLFALFTLVIVAGAGVYIQKNQDNLNAEILQNAKSTETVKEKVVETTPDEEAAALDEELKNLSDEDFEAGLLSDVNLSM